MQRTGYINLCPSTHCFGTGGMKRARNALMVKTGDVERFIEPSVSWTSNPERFIWCFPEGTGNLGKFSGIFLTDEEPLLQVHIVNLQNGAVGIGSTVIS